MRRKMTALLALFSLGSHPPVLPGQHSVSACKDASSLDIGAAEIGISLGSASRWTGLRVNARDRCLDRVNGLNLTLWTPGNPVGGTVNGLALGLIAPRAARLRGLSIGIAGVLPEREAAGITIGGLGVVSEGRLRGVSVGLLGVVSEGRADGVSIAGLGLVPEGGATGFNLGGLGVVSEGPLSGVNLAGLGIVAERRVSGINLAGLGVVSEEAIQGASAALLGLVSERAISGVSISGIGVISGERVSGITAAIATIDTRDLDGLAVAGWNRVRRRQRGLTIGLFNQAEELNGVQVGLINFAGNQHGLLRWTPILNLHFD